MLHSAWIMKKNCVSGLIKSTMSDSLTQIRRPLLFPFSLLQRTVSCLNLRRMDLFATDEHVDHFGENLALPPFLESKREQIEQKLKPLVTK